ncbi:HET-domain-containing protein, partial [Polychaeton citri CBS 116435]
MPGSDLLPTDSSNYASQTHVWRSLELPRQIRARTDDTHTVAIARNQLAGCRSHSACSRPCATRLPSRLIDVGLPNNSSSPVLRDTSDSTGEYATLSHCWGSELTLETTKSNIEAHTKSIPLSYLPATFRDAVAYTRALGLRYLWIDALCIIQDDEADWRREAAAMCSIFENGAVCLSALFAGSSGVGFLHENSLDQVEFNVQGATLGIRPRTDTLPEAIQSSKLETRAWCLQERVLAPATLYFGRHQSYWLCRSAVEPCPIDDQDPDNTEASILDVLWLGMRDLASLSDFASLSAWWDVIRNYSARQITKPTDRLPAVSGLVEKFFRRWPQSHYIYGLWSHAMLAGLLWRREPVMRARQRTAAPSWSWASVN